MSAAPKLIAALGLPGVMSAWGFAAVRTIVRELVGEHVVVESDRCEALAAARVEAAPGTCILLLSQYPEPALLEAVAATHAVPLLFLENMRSAAAYLIETTQRPALEVVRAVSASAACLAPLRERPSVLALHRARLSGRCIDVLLAYLCCQFELDPTDGQVLAITRHLGLEADHVGLPPGLEVAAGRVIKGYVPPQPETLDAATRALIDTVLGPFDALFDLRAMPPIVWPAEAFLSGDSPDNPLDGSVALTGGARCIVYGPYLHMPAGDWTARLTLSIGADTRDQAFVLEIAAGEVVGRARIVPTIPGRYAANLVFAVAHPLVPIEVRVRMENGAIEGSLTLEDVRFTPLGAALPDDEVRGAA